jgi:hypothetical protein
MTETRDRSIVASALMMLACLVLDLLAGGMLVIGVVFMVDARTRNSSSTIWATSEERAGGPSFPSGVT